MSGGPVVGQHGRVVGVASEATFAEKNEEGIPSRRFHHAVPVAHLHELEALLDVEPEGDSPNDTERE